MIYMCCANERHHFIGGMVNGLSGGDEPGQQHFHHHHEAESDADEEVRSLDLPGNLKFQ